MKRVNSVSKSMQFIVMSLFLILQSTSLYAGNKECWAQFFDKPHYQGNSFRLDGPKKLTRLTNINGGNWDKKIESIIVGPEATVTVFENMNFKLTLKEMAKHPVLMKSLGVSEQDILEDSELIFQPGTKVHSFGEFQFYHKIRSIKLECTR